MKTSKNVAKAKKVTFSLPKPKLALVEMPKWYQDAYATCKKLLATKKERGVWTEYEARRYANAYSKIDLRSVSRIYEAIFKTETKDPVILEGFPSGVYPTFKTWVGYMPKKENGLYSMWDGFGAATKCSTVYATAKKLAKQGGKVEAKATN